MVKNRQGAFPEKTLEIFSLGDLWREKTGKGSQKRGGRERKKSAGEGGRPLEKNPETVQWAFGASVYKAAIRSP